MSSWIEIAKELKTNRTPFQCLSRFQRSLNTCIIKNEWNPLEDKELRKAVAEYGESNWQVVASTLEGRTGIQCSNRWTNSLNPLRERVGKWDPDEDKRLKIAVRVYGAKNWNNIAKSVFVSGRTQIQCRERWVNCLDPSLNMNEWTEEEDLKLKAVIEKHGYCWSRIAACIPPRTDNQCRRRWKTLLPHQVRLLQVARTMKKAAFISNFVGREEERPNLTVNDFILPLLSELDPEASEDHISSNNKTQRTARRTRVDRTEEVSKLIDEDADKTNDSEGPTTFNGGKFEINKKATGRLKKKERIVKIKSWRARQVTNFNSKNKPRKSKNKVRTSSADTGNCEIEKKTTRKRKRKQRCNKEDEEMDETWERGSVSQKTTMKPCSRVKRDCRDILTNDTLMNEHCSSAQVKALRRSKRNHNGNGPKVSLTRSSSIRRTGCDEKKVVQLEDEETLGSFLSKLKNLKNEGNA